MPLGPNTVISLTTTTMEETAAVAVVEAVVGDVVGITVQQVSIQTYQGKLPAKRQAVIRFNVYT